MKRFTKVLFNIACIIGVVVAVWHFSVPYASKWFSYILDAPTEIIQSINYINFCFSFLLAGISLLLLIVQKKLFDGSGELKIFYEGQGDRRTRGQKPCPLVIFFNY